MIVVGYYTSNTPYEQEAHELAANMEQYGLKYRLYSVESKLFWTYNCAMKPEFILKGLDELQENILYTDVDSRFLRTPPFHEIEKDIPGFCICSPYGKKELISATMYFPNNELSRKILRHWSEEQQKDLGVWDQRVLESIIDNYDYFVMDEAWLKIYDNENYSGGVPIVEHYQASRKYVFCEEDTDFQKHLDAYNGRQR